MEERLRLFKEASDLFSPEKVESKITARLERQLEIARPTIIGNAAISKDTIAVVACILSSVLAEVITENNSHIFEFVTSVLRAQRDGQ